ncbi:single-stranded-DNA-specific exonuclease RecJ [Chloroflexota bacterium]
MRDWIEPQDVDVPEELKSVVGGHLIIANTLVRRGILDPDAAKAFLNPQFYTPASSLVLPDLEKAVDRLLLAKVRDETVCVWGDFDVDGQTSTALLTSALRDFGIDVIHHVPVREVESHGVNLPVLKEILGSGDSLDAQLLITCDTGISSVDEILYAQERGVDVIVTDHHDLPDLLPPAYAIVNPKMLPAGHVLSTLPGVGVAYKLVEELYRRAGSIDESDQYLDLVALGIVSDVATQTGDTRYLLQRGLEQLRSPERLGLIQMMELVELDPKYITEEHIGFILGPRLNAVGRLGDAKIGVELLTTGSAARARVLALQLEGLNVRRKLLTDQVLREALAQIEKDPSLLDYKAIVISYPTWPSGVIGIVASRLVELYNKPVILISAPEGEIGRGSARSIEGVDISAAISANEGILASYGGHPMAAGLTIEPERVHEFRCALSETIGKLGELPEPGLSIDGFVKLSELTIEFVADLERLAPFGAGNPALVFVSEKMKVKNHGEVGRGDEHIILTLEDENRAEHKVVWWNGSEKFRKSDLLDGMFDLAYSVSFNTYRGRRDIQIELVDYRIHEDHVVARSEEAKIEVIDYREELYPVSLVQRELDMGETQVWAEGEALSRFKDKELSDEFIHQIHDRFGLTPCDVLVIWTTPPGRAELDYVLEKVKPTKVILIGVSPSTARLEEFLKRLIGLVKFNLKTKHGRVILTELTAAMAHKEITVRKGVDWLSGQGYISRYTSGGDEIIFSNEDQRMSIETSLITDQIKMLLEETTAFRVFFIKSDPDTLINRI